MLMCIIYLVAISKFILSGGLCKTLMYKIVKSYGDDKISKFIKYFMVGFQYMKSILCFACTRVCVCE
jgi:hypothetical protein